MRSTNEELVRDASRAWGGCFPSLTMMPVMGIIMWLEGKIKTEKLQDFINLGNIDGGGRVYEEGNELIFETYSGKRKLVFSKDGDTYQVAAILWDRPSGGGECAIAHFAKWASRSGFPVENVMFSVENDDQFTGDEARAKLEEFLQHHGRRLGWHGYEQLVSA